MLGALRRGEVADPDAYLVSVAAVLAEYDDDVIRYVTDPRTGWPSQDTPDARFYPTIHDLRKLCDQVAHRKAMDVERDQRIAKQFADREADDRLDAQQRASGERERIIDGFNQLRSDLHASNRDDAAEAERKAKRMAAIQRGNQLAFEQECRAAGIDPAGGVSPSLRRLLAQA